MISLPRPTKKFELKKSKKNNKGQRNSPDPCRSRCEIFFKFFFRSQSPLRPHRPVLLVRRFFLYLVLPIFFSDVSKCCRVLKNDARVPWPSKVKGSWVGGKFPKKKRKSNNNSNNNNKKNNKKTGKIGKKKQRRRSGTSRGSEFEQKKKRGGKFPFDGPTKKNK